MDVVIFDEYTQERPYGWVFFVNDVYRETRDVLDMGVGGGPLIVRRDTGKLHTFGSAWSPEMYDAGAIPHPHVRQMDIDDETTFW